MRYLNIILTIIAVLVIGVILRFNSLEQTAKSFNDNFESVVGSNQALINANARLEAEVTNLRKEVSAIKESFSKK
ncbi:MAG: hypothetical protein NTY14_04670 [Candidatus Omnitrophica bacterium]|nr:hypothetical protein [Candidatus Omnitrophota bacterium]